MISGAAANVLDFGAVGDGVTDDSPAFILARAAAPGRTIYIPDGDYVVSEPALLLDAAGTSYAGESMFGTTIVAQAGFTGDAIAHNPAKATGTSGLGYISNLTLDLADQNIIGIDLSSVKNETMTNIRIIGGSNLGTAVGTGIKFAAPLLSGSYSNLVINPRVEYCTIGIHFDSGGNANTVQGGEVGSCTTGISTDPGVGNQVNTPKVFGTRIENCTTGFSEGAEYGSYFGVRIEDVTNAWDFTVRSVNPYIAGGLVSDVSGNVLNNEANATGLQIASNDFGARDIEPSTSRVKLTARQQVFAAAGVTPVPHAKNNHAGYFQNYLLTANEVGMEGSNALGTNTVIAIAVNNNNQVEIKSYDRAAGAYTPVNIGGNSSASPVRPLANNVATLGTASRRWTEVFATNGTINTSDENQKQQIATLTTAEQAVAVALKGLIRTFRFNDAVDLKGTAARIHVGVIAQSVRDAFIAEGLDPMMYSMFCSNTFYEDSNGNTSDFSADGMSEVTRLGIRYDELLAFIIAAL